MAERALPAVAWSQLAIQQLLGEGASGMIYRAEFNHAAVAVKVFKGAVTSDGLPHSEQAACLLAGTHAGLIPVLGKVGDHPEGKLGLVLSLIPPHYVNLAQPPSLASCTRDCYPADMRFSLAMVVRLATRVAEVVAHLHAQWVMHGDLYGHNLLWDEQGDCLLGDFGAASRYDTGDLAQASALQAIEIRAFACLLEELLTHCHEHATALETIAALQALQARCTAEASRRPTFSEVHQTLVHLQCKPST